MSIKGNWRRHGSEVVIRWCQRFFSRRFATLLHRFAAQFCRPQREKNLWHPGYRERRSRAESKNCEILLLPTADRRFDTKVKCPTGRARFWVKFPAVRSLARVKCCNRVSSFHHCTFYLMISVNVGQLCCSTTKLSTIWYCM